MHVIAAKAVCFGEAAKQGFKEYQQLVKSNASCLAESLISKGFHLVSGGSDNHLMLMDLRSFPSRFDRKTGATCLEKANVTLNRNTCPVKQEARFRQAD